MKHLLAGSILLLYVCTTHATTLQDLEKICNSPDNGAKALACLSISKTLAKEKRPFLALDYALKGASSGDAKCLSQVAKIYANNSEAFSLTGEEQKNLVQRYALKGCELGDGLGCSLYALYIYKDEKGKKEEIRYLKKGCDLRNAESCYSLAWYEDNLNNLYKACNYATPETSLASSCCYDYAKELKLRGELKGRYQWALEKACELNSGVLPCYESAQNRERRKLNGDSYYPYEDKMTIEEYKKVCESNFYAPPFSKYRDLACIRLNELIKAK